MSDLLDHIDSINEALNYYTITVSDKVMGEEGKYITGEGVGYAILNKFTNIKEHTTLLLPQAIFQAQHLDSMLESLIKGEDPTEAPLTPAEDVTYQ